MLTIQGQRVQGGGGVHGRCVLAGAGNVWVLSPASPQWVQLQTMLAVGLGPAHIWVCVLVVVAECEDGVQAALKWFGSEAPSAAEARRPTAAVIHLVLQTVVG